MKIYKDKTNTNFQDRKVPKENASYEYLYILIGMLKIKTIS